MRIDAVIASCDDILTMAKRLENVSCLSDPILYTCQLLIGNIQALVACLLNVVKGNAVSYPVCQLSGLLLDLSLTRYFLKRDTNEYHTSQGKRSTKQHQ